MKDVVVSTPVLAITGMNFLGYTVADWAALLSIVWVLILMVLKGHELLQKRKEDKA